MSNPKNRLNKPYTPKLVTQEDSEPEISAESRIFPTAIQTTFQEEKDPTPLLLYKQKTSPDNHFARQPTSLKRHLQQQYQTKAELGHVLTSLASESSVLLSSKDKPIILQEIAQFKPAEKEKIAPRKQSQPEGRTPQFLDPSTLQPKTGPQRRSLRRASPRNDSTPIRVYQQQAAKSGFDSPMYGYSQQKTMPPQNVLFEMDRKDDSELNLEMIGLSDGSHPVEMLRPKKRKRSNSLFIPPKRKSLKKCMTKEEIGQEKAQEELNKIHVEINCLSSHDSVSSDSGKQSEEDMVSSKQMISELICNDSEELEKQSAFSPEKIKRILNKVSKKQPEAVSEYDFRFSKDLSSQEEEEPSSSTSSDPCQQTPKHSISEPSDFLTVPVKKRLGSKSIVPQTILLQTNTDAVSVADSGKLCFLKKKTQQNQSFSQTPIEIHRISNKECKSVGTSVTPLDHGPTKKFEQDQGVAVSAAVRPSTTSNSSIEKPSSDTSSDLQDADSFSAVENTRQKRHSDQLMESLGDDAPTFAKTMRESFSHFRTNPPVMRAETAEVGVQQLMQKIKRRHKRMKFQCLGLWLSLSLIYSVAALMFRIIYCSKALSWGCAYTIMFGMLLILILLCYGFRVDFKTFTFRKARVNPLIAALMTMMAVVALQQFASTANEDLLGGTIRSIDVAAFILHWLALKYFLLSYHRLLRWVDLGASLLIAGAEFYHVDEDRKESAPIIVIISCISQGIMAGVLCIVFQALLKISVAETKVTRKTLIDFYSTKKISEEYQDLFQSIEEGIVVVKKDQLSFTNKIFRQLLKRLRLPFHSNKARVLDLPIFKLYRNCEERSDAASCAESVGRTKGPYFSLEQKSAQGFEIGKYFSIREMLKRSQNFFNDKIFEISFEGGGMNESPIGLGENVLTNNGPPSTIGAGFQNFRFVQLKINKGRRQKQDKDSKAREEKILLQIIDVSDKMLYSEVNAEQNFQTLISAAVSHELRNPLNSLILQVSSMEYQFESFERILFNLFSLLQEQQHVIEDAEQKADDKWLLRAFQNSVQATEEIHGHLDQIYEGLKFCGKKMYSAVNFIDYFVHDILDYTLISKQGKNFVKSLGVCNIKEAVNEVIGFQEDKASHKQIKIRTIFLGFPHEGDQSSESSKRIYLVNTDRKRFQQVLLNLLSNALKFTDRDGNILIVTELQRKSRSGSNKACAGRYLTTNHDFLRISVVDSGQGIKDKDKHRLFKLFGSIKDEKRKVNMQGIGLGLVISRLIVNKFNGVIDFLSRYRHGSTFFYTFQLDNFDYNAYRREEQKKQEEQQKAKTSSSYLKVKVLAPPPLPQANSPHTLDTILRDYSLIRRYSQCRILVADDEEFCLSSMKTILASQGIDSNYQADFCINGKEALDLVKLAYSNGLHYRLILTDFNMPVMDGIQATKKIRQYLSSEQGLSMADQPAIVGITGHVHQSFKEQGVAAGLDEIMPKPMYVSDLQQLLKTYKCVQSSQKLGSF